MTADAEDRSQARDDGVRLAIVTCGPQLEVALSALSSRVASVVRLGGVTPRSTLVVAAVDLLVEDAGIGRDEIGEVVVSRGPGSFTGIRAGLATASGLVAALGARCLAFDSLLMQAARAAQPGEAWCAQPGRRGEVYAQPFDISGDRPPVARGGIEILTVEAVGNRGPWIAAEALDLGAAERLATSRSSAEALLLLAEWGVEPGKPEPLYVEGPPVSKRSDSG